MDGEKTTHISQKEGVPAAGGATGSRSFPNPFAVARVFSRFLRVSVTWNIPSFQCPPSDCYRISNRVFPAALKPPARCSQVVPVLTMTQEVNHGKGAV